MMQVRYGVLLMTLLLAACASMSPEECARANWQQIGQRDGSLGLNASRLNQHAKACQKVNIVPNHQQYQQGHQIGVQHYCQPQTVFARALAGYSNVALCPVSLQADLRRFASVPAAYLQAKADWEKLLDRSEQIEAILFHSEGLTERQYHYYRYELSRLRRDILIAQLELNQQQQNMWHLQRELEMTKP